MDNEAREKIKDRVKAHIYQVLLNHRFVCTAEWGSLIADEILSAYELAVVDREAGLPSLSGYSPAGYRQYRLIQQDMLNQGWVKEVKE